jgi:hypothetical protein
VAPLPETDAAYRTALTVATARTGARVGDVIHEPSSFAPILVTSA